MAATKASEPAADLAYLRRALKVPSLAQVIDRLAERARADGWTHEEFLAACLERDVAARQAKRGVSSVSVPPGSRPARRSRSSLRLPTLPPTRHARPPRRIGLRRGPRQRRVPRPTRSPQSPTRLTYAVTEVAALLGISRSKAYACVRTGELPAIRIGRRVVVPRRAIDALLACGSAGPVGGNQVEVVLGGTAQHPDPDESVVGDLNHLGDRRIGLLVADDHELADRKGRLSLKVPDVRVSEPLVVDPVVVQPQLPLHDVNAMRRSGPTGRGSGLEHRTPHRGDRVSGP
jgi:excisionase family DNA binding protein